MIKVSAIQLVSIVASTPILFAALNLDVEKIRSMFLIMNSDNDSRFLFVSLQL